MPTPKKSVRYRAWNQTRVAKYVMQYVALIEAWRSPYPEFRLKPEAHGVEGIMRKVLRDAAIVQLATIEGKGKGNEGVNLRRLVHDGLEEGLIGEEEVANLVGRIDAHSLSLKKIRVLRNCVVAHRSQELSFREVIERHPLSHDELKAVAQMYYDVSREFYETIGPFLSTNGTRPGPWQIGNFLEQAEAYRSLLLDPTPPERLAMELDLIRRQKGAAGE